MYSYWLHRYTHIQVINLKNKRGSQAVMGYRETLSQNAK